MTYWPDDLAALGEALLIVIITTADDNIDRRRMPLEQTLEDYDG